MQRILAILVLVGMTTIIALFVIPCGWLGVQVEPNLGVVVIPGAEVEYYDIQGGSAEELWNDVEKNNPNPEGQAVTKLTIGWKFSENFYDTGCVISDIQVDQEITVVAPRWINPEAGPLPLIQEWDAYMKGVTRHEANHVRIYLENDERVQEAIEQSDCETAGAAAQAAYEETARLQIEYDDITQHGAKEGIFFPAIIWYPWNL